MISLRKDYWNFEVFKLDRSSPSNAGTSSVSVTSKNNFKKYIFLNSLPAQFIPHLARRESVYKQLTEWRTMWEAFVVNNQVKSIAPAQFETTIIEPLKLTII